MRDSTFSFDGQTLEYFTHPYNRAGENMRTVEVPIVLAFLRGREWDSLLEVGNVLSHYVRRGWPVVDGIEQGRGIINADILTWKPERLFHLIVSISTLEHIGHGRYAQLSAPDATPRQAWQNMMTWLAPGGELLATVPLNYNAILDAQIISGMFDTARYMRRTQDNAWVECSLPDALGARRPDGYPWAVGMAVLYGRWEGSVDTLHLGAGNRPIKGAVNHDVRLDEKRPWITVAHDLNARPWPWENNSFDRIVSRAVFEHLDIDLVASLNECWRILRPGGCVYLKLPHWNSDIAHQDPTHRWFFSMKSFDQFDPDRRRGQEYAFYTDRYWKIVKGPRLNDARSSIHITLEVRK